jgi:hypothetical protein
LAWRADEGGIEGVDVSGLGVALSASSLGIEAKWQAVIHVDERATPVQHDWLLKLVTGQLGGGFDQLAALIGDVRAIERSPIVFEGDHDHTQLSIGRSIHADR